MTRFKHPLIFVVFLLFLLCPTTSALKFLFYNPLFGRSHVMYVGKMADLLAKAGHDVVSYQPVISKDFNDTGVKLARNIQRQPDFELNLDANIFGHAMWRREGADLWKMMKSMNQLVEFFALSCEHQLRDDKLMDKLRAENFDFALTEHFDVCGMAVFERIGVKKYGALIASTLSNLFTAHYGVPSTLSFVPEMTVQAIPPFSFWDRTKNLLVYGSSLTMFLPKMMGPISELSRKYVRPDFDLMVRLQEASVIFVNVDEFLDFPRPITHKIHYCGGIGMLKGEKLGEKYEKIFASSKRGVVYMSFGTVTKSRDMPPETKSAFLDAFAEFPDVTFLWKYEAEDGVADGYKNVITGQWWPQKDLLVHPKLLAFITHGGANSISEAATAGAPVITIPLFGDQSRNALMAEYRGFGVLLENLDLTKEKVVEALRKIIENDSYKKNATALAQIIKAKPYTPEETFIRYSEFAARFDLDERLDLYGRHLPFWEFYNLDVMGFLAASLLTVVVILFVVLRCCVKCVWRRVRKEKRE